MGRSSATFADLFSYSRMPSVVVRVTLDDPKKDVDLRALFGIIWKDSLHPVIPVGLLELGILESISHLLPRTYIPEIGVICLVRKIAQIWEETWWWLSLSVSCLWPKEPSLHLPLGSKPCLDLRRVGEVGVVVLPQWVVYSESRQNSSLPPHKLLKSELKQS